MRQLAVPAALALLLSGCATVMCQPITIVVAETRRDEQLVSNVESMRMSPVSGRVEMIRSATVETH
jgi:uncharacterized protein YceK